MRTSLRKDGPTAALASPATRPARGSGEPPFRRLLIANRGEIALRIIRACRELGVATVAVFSDADVDAPHVRAADASVRLGPPPAAESYLRIQAVVEAAVATGAEAIHPGYGFLSERAAFAKACAEAGVVFVGPTAKTLAGLGDKLAARRSAAAVGVPIVPGTLEPAAVDDPSAVAGVVAEGERIGWPLLVKAAAGGGGRGMRRVERAADLPAALASASREAAAAFGDGAVYLERLVEGARHIEVQLLGDAEGNVVALGERDCSVQRRHQKLVEEAPAPGLTTEQRRDLHALGVAVARAVGLRNAATAEFLWSPEGRPWFLEVNARLQVEHGVTELVSGLDLVHEQLWLAAGEPLSDAVVAAAEVAALPGRHAIEVRLSAEDPARAFAPVAGLITTWRVPAGPGVRLDGWVEAGTRVTATYDALLAKLIVVAADRPAALARLARALDEFEITGIQTTLPFDRWLVASPAFRAGELANDFVDRLWRPAELVEVAAGRAALAAIATDAGAPPAGAPVDAAAGRTWSRDGWAAAGRLEAVERWPR